MLVILTHKHKTHIPYPISNQTSNTQMYRRLRPILASPCHTCFFKWIKFIQDQHKIKKIIRLKLLKMHRNLHRNVSLCFHALKENYEFKRGLFKQIHFSDGSEPDDEDTMMDHVHRLEKVRRRESRQDIFDEARHKEKHDELQAIKLLQATSHSRLKTSPDVDENETDADGFFSCCINPTYGMKNPELYDSTKTLRK